MQTAKNIIASTVKSYQEIFKQEFDNFIIAQRPKVEAIRSKNKLATLEGSEVVEFQTGEMPETLYILLLRNLGSDEYQWYQSKPGQKWFYNNFTQYKVTGGKL